MLRYFVTCFFACLFFNMAAVNAQSDANWFVWKVQKKLPAKNGLSGTITGISNGALIVAGGNNFDKRIQEGGKKHIYNDIYVCIDPAADSLVWINAGKLPYPVVDAATVSFNNRLLVIGGSNGKKPYRNVISLTWNRDTKKVDINTNYPKLPQARSGLSAIITKENKLYIAGGKSAEDAPGNNFWSSTLNASGEKLSTWQQLPDLPGEGRFGAALIAQNDGEFNSIYLAGGKSTSTYLTDAYKFTPHYGEVSVWTKIKDLPRPAFFASAMAYGQSHALLFGGSVGPSAEAAIALGDKYKMADDILAYHTITDTWITAGYLPHGIAGATVIQDNDRIELIGGELRPGVKSDLIMSGKPVIAIQKSKFGIIDYATVIIYLIILAGISFYFSRNKNTTDDYLRGGQRIPYWAAGISVMATQVSAIGFMSIPAKSYATNWSYFAGVWTWFLVVPIVTWAFIPFFRKLDVTSAYEYLERRFDKWTRLFSGVIYCLYQLGRMGLVIYLPAVALSAVSPIDTFTCILIMGVLSTLYTIVGGIEAVIWIEVIQAGLLMGGAIICVILAVIGIDGGVSEFVDVAVTHNKFSFGSLNLDFTSSALGVILIGNIFNRFGNLISDQAIVQRYMTTKNVKEAKKSLWIDVAVSVPWAIVIYLLGTALYVFYKSNPQMLNPVTPTDGILPQFIAQRAPSGLSGLIIAAIFAASMSTVESHIHSLATIFTTDFYARFAKSVTEKKKLNFARWTTGILGLVATLLALLLLTVDIKSILDVFTELTGLFIGAAGGLFLLGIFTEKTNSTGALIGAVASCLLLYFIQTQTHINFWLYSAVGFASCFIVGYLSSFMLKGRRQLQGLTIYTLNEKIFNKEK
ncbi:MAG: sodium/solute symporter [Bacteroidota bacterium]